MNSSAYAEPIAANYRLRLAQLLPAILLAYIAVVWPALFEQAGASADLMARAAPSAAPNLLNRLVLPGLAGFSLLILVAERHHLRRFHLFGLVLVLGLFAYLGMTALWALAPSTTIAKLSGLSLQTIPLLVGALAARHVGDTFGTLFWVFAAVIVANLFAVMIIPPTAIGYAGLYSHKNSLGNIAAISGLFMLYGLTRGTYRQRLLSLGLLLLACVLVYVSRSKTALGLFALTPMLALIMVMIRRYLRVATPILVALMLVPAVFVMNGTLIDFSFSDVSLSVTGDATFTGRTEIWAFATDEIAKRPMLGYGYQSFWNIGTASPAASLPEGFVKVTPNAHNGYLDLLLQGGLVAFVLFAMLLVMVSWWIDRLTDQNGALGFLATALVVYLTLQNLLETTWLDGFSVAGLLASLMIFFAALHRGGEGRA